MACRARATRSRAKTVLHWAMLRMLALLLLLPTATWAGEVNDPTQTPLTVTGLHCRDGDGNARQLGAVICVTASCQTWMARCERSLNVTTWRKISDGCPTVSARPLPVPLLERLYHARDALGIDAQVAASKAQTG